MTHWTVGQLPAAMRQQVEAKLRASGTVRNHRLADEKELAGKHHAAPVLTEDGRFDSKWEYACWKDLKLRQMSGQVRNLRRQVKFSLFMAGGEHLGTYKADFVYDEMAPASVAARMVTPACNVEWVRVVADAKSSHTRQLPEWRRTKKLMLACHAIDVLELVKWREK